LYFITLGEALRRVKPAQLANLMIEQQWVEEPRRLTEIVDAIDELVTKVWYNRHQVRRERVENGKTKLVEKETFPIKDHRTRPIQRDIWEGALKAAAEVDKRFGLENLGPWDDFEWGMLNGFAASEAACLLGLQRAASLVTWQFRRLRDLRSGALAARMRSRLGSLSPYAVQSTWARESEAGASGRPAKTAQRVSSNRPSRVARTSRYPRQAPN
jgi:hypothetical protein